MTTNTMNNDARAETVETSGEALPRRDTQVLQAIEAGMKTRIQRLKELPLEELMTLAKENRPAREALKEKFGEERAANKEGVEVIEAQFYDDVEKSKQELKKKSFEELMTLAKENFPAREALEEKFDEEKAANKEGVEVIEAQFYDDLEKSRQEMKKKLPEELVDLVNKNNLLADEALEEQLEEASATNKQKNAEIFDALGIKQDPSKNQTQLAAAGELVLNPSNVEPQELVAAIDTANMDRAKALQAIREQDPGKADAVEQILRERGDVIKELPQEPAETDMQKILREEKTAEGQDWIEDLERFQEEMKKLDMNDPKQVAQARQKIEGGKAKLQDIMSHHFFESKGFKIFKGGTKGIFFVAFYLALILVVIEMNFIIAIGKGSSGK
jgi:hypothetical protein